VKKKLQTLKSFAVFFTVATFTLRYRSSLCKLNACTQVFRFASKLEGTPAVVFQQLTQKY